MEEEAPSRRSVAELAGRFRGLAPPHDAAGHEAEKPVRRRPPRSLQLSTPQGDDQEPTGVTSPLPAKAKRNSALIEKLQANLALSPSALLPSPKSPGFRLLPPAFPASSPCSNPVTTVTTSSTATPTSPVATPLLTEEEGPTSFEAPPIVGEGSILSNDNIKGRARHSIRRRPPSRRHKKSSSGDEVGLASEAENTSQSSTTEPEDRTTGGGEEGGGGGGGAGGGEGEVFKQEDQTDASTCPETNKSTEEDHSEVSVEPMEEEEKMKEGESGSTGGKEGDDSSSGRKEEEKEEKEEEEAQEKNSAEKQKEDLTGGATNTEEDIEQGAGRCSVR